MKHNEEIPEIAGYTKEPRTIKLLTANLLAVAAMLISFVIGMIICKLIHGTTHNETSITCSIIFIVAFIAGLVIHELLHGIAWMLATHCSWKNISFGFIKGNPCCHCNRPMDKRSYVIGALTPFILLGLIPWLAGILAGTWYLISFGAIYIAGAMGDILMVWAIRHEANDTKVYDHPSEAGCFIYRKEERQPTD